MIRTFEDIKKEITRLEKETGFYLGEHGIEVKMNGRLQRYLGVFKSRGKTLPNKDARLFGFAIEFSKNLLNGFFSEEEIRDTVIHEFSHAVVDHGQLKSKLSNHGDTWRTVCINLGGSGETYYRGEGMKNTRLAKKINGNNPIYSMLMEEKYF